MSFYELQFCGLREMPFIMFGFRLYNGVFGFWILNFFSNLWSKGQSQFDHIRKVNDVEFLSLSSLFFHKFFC